MKTKLQMMLMCVVVGYSHAAILSVDHDALDRATKVARDETVTTKYAYDAAGNRTRKTTRHAAAIVPPVIAKGRFLGTIDVPSGGLIPAQVSVNVVTTGTFTASLLLNGRKVSWTGKLVASNGGVTTWIGSVTDLVLGQLALRLELPAGGGQMTFTLTRDSVTNTSLLALIGQIGSGEVAAGNYTVILAANPDFPDDAYPQGDGYATLRVATNGIVTLTGKLGDSTPVTQSTALTSDGRFQVFVPLYKNGGVITGWIDFIPINEVSDFNGTLLWTKPVVPNQSYYPEGFELILDILGSKFTPPLKGRRIFNFNPTEGRSLLGFARGNLTDVILKESTLSIENKLSISNPGVEAPQYSFTATNGLFSGSFVHSGVAKRIPFAGVVFQKQSIASGHFLGANQAGLVTLQKDLFSGLIMPSVRATEPDNELKTPPVPPNLVFRLANEFNYYDSAWPENGYPNSVFSEIPIAGKFEDTADGLQFRASRPRGGGSILTKNKFILAGKSVEFVWEGSGGGSFMQPACGFTPNQSESEWNVDNGFIVCEFGNIWSSWLASPGITYRTTVTFDAVSAILVTKNHLTGQEYDRKTRAGNFNLPLRPFLRGGDTQNQNNAFLRLKSLSIRPSSSSQ